jgi:hypothetical protein
MISSFLHWKSVQKRSKTCWKSVRKRPKLHWKSVISCYFLLEFQ